MAHKLTFDELCVIIMGAAIDNCQAERCSMISIDKLRDMHGGDKEDWDEVLEHLKENEWIKLLRNSTPNTFICNKLLEDMTSKELESEEWREISIPVDVVEDFPLVMDEEGNWVDREDYEYDCREQELEAGW